MRDVNIARDARPSLTWVPVVDARGRTHMEAHWSVTTPATLTAPVTADHHAA